MQASDRQPNRPVTEAATLTERAAMLVEQDILAGHLAPGSRLGIVDLVQRYEIGATPLREGLSRLMSRGLIVGIGQRGFRVADISREDLLDITCMRTAIEVEAIRLAIIHGDDAWEAVTDTWHASVADAMTQAEFEYAGVSGTWQQRL